MKNHTTQQNCSEQDVDRIALKENGLLIISRYFVGLGEKYEQINVPILERDICYPMS